MRVFAAVPMPDGVVEAVEEWMAPLRRRHPGPRWVTADRLHMTLRFLGDVGRERAEELAEALQAYGGGPVQFRLERVGRFRKGRHGPARVLWIGGSFEDGMEELARLAGRVPDERGRRERRRFIPHLTVARSRRRRGAIPEDLPPFGPVDGIADRAVVYNSRLTPEGPEYSILRSLRL